MTRSLPAIALLLAACSGEATVETNCDATNSADVTATVVTVDQGLGIESIDTTFTSCADRDLLIHQDCCGLQELRLEKEGPTGTWTPIDVGSTCTCTFLDPQVLLAGQALTFPTGARDPALCDDGGGTYRAVYGIAEVGCKEVGCYDELISSTWQDYCEG